MSDSVPASLVMTRIGGRDYPLRSVHNCKTCQSPHRVMIEQMLLDGRSPHAIALEVEKEADAGHLGHPDRTRILAHYKSGHMPLPVSAQVAIVERRAKEIGQDYESATQEIADFVTANRLVLQRGIERLQAGEIEVDGPMLMNAIKTQSAIDAEMDGGVDNQVWATAFIALGDAIKRVMPPDLYEVFQREIRRDPTLRALRASVEEKQVLEHQT